jgi:hypothetical protein
MKHTPKLIALVAIALLALASCNVFVFSTNDLKGKTVTYYFDYFGSSNGHDTTTLVFDDTGKAGTFTTAAFTYNYATAADYATGDYSKRSWFQNNGQQGTFTYDPDTSLFSITINSYYAPAATATYIYGSVYAAADYSYQDIDAIYSTTGLTYTNSADTYSTVAQLNADNILSIYVAGATDGTWLMTRSNGWTRTVNGTTSSSTGATTETLTVSEASFLQDSVTVNTSVAGASTTVTNYEEISTYAINHFFLVGQDDKTDAAFTDVWKKGNTVTIQYERTQYDEIEWTTAKPAAPTVAVSTGEGTTGTYGTAPYYYIDKNVSGGYSMSITNAGDYISFPNYSVNAYRHIKVK